MKPKTMFLGYGTLVLLMNSINAVQFTVSGDLERRDEFACNTQVVLQCLVEPKTTPVFWQIGKPVVPTTASAAECSGDSCSINPAVSGVYNFSYNDNNGISNLTILNVTLAEDGKEYLCDDGSSPPPSPFTSVVQVPPVKATTRILGMVLADGKTEISVTTGCVSPRSANLIEFKWFTLKEGETNSKEYTPSSSQALKENEAPCQGSSDCLTSGSVEISDSFTIEEDENAPRQAILVQVIFGDVILFTQNSSSTFHRAST